MSNNQSLDKSYETAHKELIRLAKWLLEEARDLENSTSGAASRSAYSLRQEAEEILHQLSYAKPQFVSVENKDPKQESFQYWAEYEWNGKWEPVDEPLDFVVHKSYESAVDSVKEFFRTADFTDEYGVDSGLPKIRYMKVALGVPEEVSQD